MNDRIKVIVTAGGLVVGSVLAHYLWRKRRTSRIRFPSTARWRPIGTLENIVLYPMKSGGYVDLQEAECTELGLKQLDTNGIYTLKDRNFVVYRLDSKEMVYAMTFPQLTSIKISPLDENSVLFSSQDKQDLRVVIPFPESNKQKAMMWTEEVMDFVDCGDEAADWITELVKGNKDVQGKLRIGYWSYDTKNMTKDENFNSRGAYQNYTSYMLMTSPSLDDLKSRVPQHQLNFRQFRPNFFIDTILEPYAEDEWFWVKIGEDDGAAFYKIKNCTRCSQINIDPDQHLPNKKNEPLTTLKKYRQMQPNEGPLMGICLGLYKAGQVQIGDTVYIAV